MSMFTEILHEPQVQRWAMALMHFLWQGCVIAAITSMLLRMLREAAPATRYATCLIAFTALTAAPFFTFMAIQPPVTPFARESLQLTRKTAEIAIVPMATPVVSSIDLRRVDAAPTTGELNLFDGPWETARTWLVAFWFLGELLLGAWLLAAMVAIQLARRATTPAPRELADVVVRLSSAMGLSKAPPIFCSNTSRDAASIGFFRPWILIPSAWLVQMTPEMLEAVLAHELIHIRRHDLWVNLLQRLAEIVLFCHPAVWWLSRRIREERELCCDAATVKVTGKRKVYAQTLAHAARQRAAESFLGLATNLGDDRMSLLNRVEWVLRERRSAVRSDWWPAGVVAVLVPVLLTFGLPDVASKADEKPNALAPVRGVAATPAEQAQIPSPSTPVDQPPAQEEVARPARLRWVHPSPTPSESHKVTLPDYVIEPPDILLIEGVRLLPKVPYKIQPQDILSIVVLGTTPDRPIVGQFQVESSGDVKLGPGYGNVKVAGLTTDEASAAIQTILLRELSSPEVAVSLFRGSSQKMITGEHLVAPDGTVNLGIYGRVYVAGMTVEEGRAAIEKQLVPHFDKPKVSLDVFVYNSKFYYVLDEGTAGGSVIRMPISGNETVLDAIAQIGGLEQLSERKLWISRPAPSGVAVDQVLPIDWHAITRGAKASTNYQLMPGDRLFVSEPSGGRPKSANAGQIEGQLDQYNRLIGQWRIDEAIDLAKQLKDSKSTSEIAKLIAHHADLVQMLVPERELTAIKRAKDVAQRQLAFEIWREQKKSEWLVRQRLTTKVMLDYDGRPLQEVLRDISRQADLVISVDQQALDQQGVTVRMPISAKLTEKISARSALNLILEPLRLTFESFESGIRVTSTVSATDVYTQVYYVGNLVMKANLIELITSTIAPNSWDKVGGPASVVPFYGNLSVVVSQTEEGHAEVKELVDRLKKLYLDSSDDFDDQNDRF